MRKLPAPLFFTAAALLLPAPAQTVLTEGHVDIGIAYEDGTWNLHVHDEASDTEYDPADAILAVAAAAETVVSSDPDFAFLGNPGDPVWVLPQEQQPGLLFLGVGTEEILAGTFLNDEVTLTLTGFAGPAGESFFLYLTDSFGEPTVAKNTADGLGVGDAITRPVGAHQDYNWAFTAPGTYELTFTATARLPDTTPVSGSATYRFQVVPEPSAGALLAAGGILLAGRRRRRREGLALTPTLFT